MKLRIVSNGTGAGTRLLTEDGQEIEDVRSVAWTCEGGAIARVAVILLAVPVEVEVDQRNVAMVPLGLQPPRLPESDDRDQHQVPLWSW
jgi:hypothetical protein